MESTLGAAFLFYQYKFLSFARDKNLYLLPTMDKNLYR